MVKGDEPRPFRLELIVAPGEFVISHEEVVW